MPSDVSEDNGKEAKDGNEAFMRKLDGEDQRGPGSARLAAVIVLIFALMGVSIWGIATKTYDDMSEAAISNLNENLSFISSTVEAIFHSETDFQQVTAEEVASYDDPLASIAHIPVSDAASLVSFVPEGDATGVSNDGSPFDPSVLDFSTGESVKGFSLSASYVNHMGTWAYTMACPVERGGRKLGTLYMEYTFDTVDRALPSSFYGDNATLYLMDVASERFVLKPEGMGERDAGHLNLRDFYRANAIDDADIMAMVAQGVETDRNVMFMHEVQGKESLCFLWSMNGGATYLVGFVPMEEIQKEAQAVNVALVLVACVTALAFCLCVALFALDLRKQALARRSREAERALYNEQLSKALQAAQLANESKSTFLANMSHDIRTPMNAVLGFASIIGREADNPAKVRDYAQKITSSGKHLLGLINDVLDISKIESGKTTLTFEAFDLGESLSAVESIIAPMAAEKGQRFVTEITSLPQERVIGDETHINQVLINVLSNAVKYTPEGGKIWLRFIGLPQRSERLARIRIEVEDTGCGMSQEFLKTIFDAFSRAENSTTNKVQGTGLGMSIAKSLVDLMGGTIAVTSEEGVGSLFTIDLELRIPEDQALGSFWEHAGIRRLLVVDGSSDLAAVVRGFMEGTGVTVDTASSVDEALDGLAAHDCQVVLYGCTEVDEDSLAQADRLLSTAKDALLIFVQDHNLDSGDSAVLPPRTGALIRPFFPSMLKEQIASLKDLGNGDVSQFDHVLEGKRFLAAEDNHLNAYLLTDLLGIEGAEVEVVENGQLVVERFENCKPGEFDAILMDVQMPVMNGYEATQAIRALQRPDAATIPIFAMTANAFAEDERVALSVGMNAHLTKPLETDSLKRAVERFVEKGNSHGQR